MLCVDECTSLRCEPPESVHPDSPEGQEVLGFHAGIVLPTRDILWVCP